MREKWGCLEINWNTGTTGTLFFLRGFSSAVMPLLSKALPFQGCPPLLGPFCDGPSPRWPQPFARSFDSRVFPSPCVSLRLIPPSSPVISRYLTQSHPIASYRTAGLAERLNFAA